MEIKKILDFETACDIAGKKYALNNICKPLLIEGCKLSTCLVTGSNWSGAIEYTPELLKYANRAFLTFSKTERKPSGFATKEGLPNFARFKAVIRYTNKKTAYYPSFDNYFKFEGGKKINIHSEQCGFDKLLALLEKERVKGFLSFTIFANITTNLSTKPFNEGGGDFGYILFTDYNSTYKRCTGLNKGTPRFPVFTNGIFNLSETERQYNKRQLYT